MARQWLSFLQYFLQYFLCFEWFLSGRGPLQASEVLLRHAVVLLHLGMTMFPAAFASVVVYVPVRIQRLLFCGRREQWRDVLHCTIPVQ